MSHPNDLPPPGSRIAVAMSGGVDSSVAALLLARAGYDCIGFTAWTLNGPGKCCNDALVNAGRVCDDLGMAYDTVDLRAEFAHYVMDHYQASYAQGLTPNPCVECNRFVKWEALVRYAVAELKVDYVATGHYARIQHGPDGEVRIFRPADARKDQTYMMARVHRKDLARTVFPLGDMTKPEVLAIAREANLPTAYSKESQDVCFVLEGQANYLKGVLGVQTGPVVDIDTGKVLGEHEGYFTFTVGQRKGVKVAAGRPIYVVRVDPHTNTVYVGDAAHLETARFRVLHPHWLVPGFEQAPPERAMVKIRYNSPAVPGVVMPDPEQPGALTVTVQTPVTSVTPGQVAVFYDESDTQLWGGGYIEAHLPQADFDPATAPPPPTLTCATP